MHFGFLSWNWCVWTQNRDHLKLRLLDRLDWDVAALQEVAPTSVTKLRDQYGAHAVVTPDEPCASSTPPEHRGYGCVIVARNGAHVSDASAIPEASTADEPLWDGSDPLPGSLVSATVTLRDGSRLTAIAAHAPHSARRGDDRLRRIERKLRTYAALEAWIAERLDVVIGIDGNAWIDGGRADLFDSPTARDGPQVEVDRFFLDGPGRHGVRDVFRSWLDGNPATKDRLQRRRPEGPLAVTFVRGSNRVVADRFDAVMASPTFAVRSVEHDYEDSVCAGSDHSYVLATLERVRPAE